MDIVKTEPLVVERVFNASIEKVWKAITDKEQMKHWYFDLAEFKPEVGLSFSLKVEKMIEFICICVR